MPDKTNGGIEYRYSERSGAPKLENGRLSGRAAPFNKATMIGKKPWGFREQIAPGCFSKSINDGDVVLLDSHQTEKPLARQSAGTLSLEETKNGLDWDAEPADTSYANDVRENVKAGNYGGCSFGFEVIRDSWHYNKDEDVDERTLHEVKLHEISVVTFPAYTEGTSVSARDQVDAAMEARDAFYYREYGVWVMDGISEDEDRAGKSPFGTVAYADPGYQKDGKKRYPIDNAAHAKAAWSYINKASNQAPYSAKQLASIKSKVQAACKKFGVKVSAGSSSSSKNSAVIESEGRVKTSSKSGATLKGGRKILAQVREVAFDEARADDPGKQLGRIRQILLADLVKQAERSNTPAVSGNGNNGVGTGAENDSDSDDTTCPACSGKGVLADGVTRCPGGCAGTGKISKGGDNKGGTGTDAAGDNKGDKGVSSDGLGLKKKSKKANVPTSGTAKGSVDAIGSYTSGSAPSGTPSKGHGSPGGSGTPVQATGTYSKDIDGDTRDGENGQPDTSTDQEGKDDAARKMRAIARKRRMQFDAEAE